MPMPMGGGVEETGRADEKKFVNAGMVYHTKVNDTLMAAYIIINIHMGRKWIKRYDMGEYRR